MSDSILQRVAAGDPRAVQDCIDQYKNLIWSLVRRQLLGEDAEDAVQEIFIEIWKSAGRYDPKRSSEPAFVAMIARRRLIDRRRRRQRQPAMESLEPRDDEMTREVARVEAGPVEAVAEAALAARAIKTLEPHERRVLLMSVCQGLSHSEIANTTELPLGTVKTYIRRGLARVRERLESGSAAASGASL